MSIDTWLELAHPEDLKQSEELLRKHFTGHTEYYQCELRMKHKDGYWVWVHDRGKVIEWDEKGNPVWMFGTHTDITAQKEMEQSIRELSIRDPLTNVYNRRYLFEDRGTPRRIPQKAARVFGHDPRHRPLQGRQRRPRSPCRGFHPEGADDLHRRRTAGLRSYRPPWR
ncbi:MAG: PAS domain-containing protein [Marinilabiliales bacterium]|nr:PAS domain-containing protein [Marinilabiliales bacterium]